jgi:hypothetical protein
MRDAAQEVMTDFLRAHEQARGMLALKAQVG